MPQVSDYTSLITSEHNQRPNFTAMISAIAAGSVDGQNLLASFVSLFDLDQAVGQQLDCIGQWVGVTRNLAVPLTGVYFSFDTAKVGFDQGSWFGPGNPIANLITLPDDSYRILLRGQIAANQWDGTVPGAYHIWSLAFQLNQFAVLIQDNQDMSITIIFLTQILSAVVKALLLNGLLIARPAAVRITGYFQPSGPGPVFGFDSTNPNIKGFDQGSWIVLTAIS